MDYNKLAELLFPDVVNGPDYYEKKFPERDLPKGAEVTRMAPSPTGFIHLGNLYSALADERIAHRNGGVFYLRIEDTDEKRKVDGAVETIINVLRYFDIEFDEGAGFTDADPQNVYGPYFQRQRVEIYHAYAKDLVKRGLAYPCFCTEEELEEVRKEQEEDKAMTGYYGKYAVCRNLTLEDIEAKLKAGLTYVLRLRSAGSPDKEIVFHDRIMGEIKLPENIHDIVLLKRDGVPTYHFAHAIDDHLMRTTMVIRGGEWLASVPTHYELFHVLGFKMPSYGHTAHLMKFDEETGGKRKLSKRKDPELSLDYYRKDGYHPMAMKVYLLTLLNSNFEEWYEKFPDKDIKEFPFSVEKMSQSGALFDKDKLHNICKNELAKLSEEEMYDFLYDWAAGNEPEKAKVWFANREKMLAILRLYMGIGMKRRRKDFIYAKQIFELIGYFFEENNDAEEFKFDKDTVKEILKEYLAGYDHNDDNSAWFDKLKKVADNLSFASDMKAYKANPENYKGSISDIAEVVRIAVTGRANTPDLWTIIHIIGEDAMKAKIERLC
ncbi:glutamate--tRNA ligase [Eshraghiella crossota]|jgi:glutamyl-tRNA synthetase|uniref:glutamate--tRNA ligase n=1 Tax=Eshraghiella crossota TaxID=45851 RepID=UPI0009646B4A|nr:MAG: glutamate--tRNA ligase [Butyrivibrio crossotus]